MRRALTVLGLLGVAAAPVFADGGSIEGVITYAADAPAPEMKDVPADKQGDCGMKVPIEELVVDAASKGIKYAVVYIDKAPKSEAKPGTKIVLDQKSCNFMPHITVAQVGATVDFANTDKASHNVNVKALKNKAFNRQITAGGAPIEWTAEAAENVQIVCDIHPWMKSYLIVKDHPYVAITDEKGAFKLLKIA